MSKLFSSLFFDNPKIPEQICQFCQSIPEYVQAREEYYALAQELEETMGRQWYFTFEDRLNQWRDFRGRSEGGASRMPRPTKCGNGSAGGPGVPPLRKNRAIPGGYPHPSPSGPPSP